MVGMFTCARIKATKGKGADFYRQHLSCNDYYSEHEVVKGVWHGTLADDFQLSGKDVTQSVFSAFQQNIDPVSGKKLTARNVENAVLEKYSDIDKTELAEIHRQQDEEYRRGILMASEGDVGGAFEQLDSHGFIHENQGRYLDAAVDSFLRLTEDGKRPLDCIAVSPTNRECELLTDKIRAKMKSKG